ncbi:hypothetical protein PV772_03510 [Pseudarthrobacter sp. CC12]|uniref:hypothetical protein n=1 Tax=Pseudarthrobacter sp. CC12 TaxID=3029193 RepID=UPI003265FB13
MAELKDLGFIDQLTRGGNLGRASKGMASIYQLTVPSDLVAEAEGVPPLGHDPLEEVPAAGHLDPEQVPESQEQVPVEIETGPNIDGTGPGAGTLPLQTHPSNKTPLQNHPQSVTQADAHEEQGEIDLDIPAKKPPLSKAALAKQIAEDFTEWYEVYPKHIGRGAATNAYAKARKSGAGAEELMAGARRYAAERKGEDPKFTAQPATWLNQERWLDDPTHMGEIDVDAILGKDYWTPGTPPAGLSVSEEIGWKKEQRALHNAERLKEAKAKQAATGWKLGLDQPPLGPWDPAYHQRGKLTTSQKMQNTITNGMRLQAQYNAARGLPTVPRQYEWCNPPREIEAPEEEQSA